VIERKKRKQFGTVVFSRTMKSWNFKWWENGKRRSKTIGNKRDYPTKTAAWEAAKPFIKAMEAQVLKEQNSILVQNLVDLYRCEKMPERYSTRRSYECWLGKHILPR
jgi:hypothetical protein